jgi:hypothetical protein
MYPSTRGFNTAASASTAAGEPPKVETNLPNTPTIAEVAVLQQIYAKPDKMLYIREAKINLEEAEKARAALEKRGYVKKWYGFMQLTREGEEYISAYLSRPAPAGQINRDKAAVATPASSIT